LAKEVICKFGMHYGGVDIVYSLNRNKPYVLEINSTPCLTDDTSNTLDIYTDKFLGLAGIKQKKK
jgi:glutathione synthase/RimK-type ligase-like ATP-grasp enzyme